MGTLPTSAMIFAAGFGTRMGALTKALPKPMLPVAGRPMIDHSVELLRDAGIKNLVVNTHYLHERIAPHLEALNLLISHESEGILDTGGGLRHARDLLDDGPVVTMNPDAAWRGSNPVQTLLSAWRPKMEALLLVVPIANAVARQDAGDFFLKGGKLGRKGDYVYTGLQILDLRLLEGIPETAFSLNRVWDDLISTNALSAVVYDGLWCDIGHPGGLVTAEQLMSSQDV